LLVNGNKHLYEQTFYHVMGKRLLFAVPVQGFPQKSLHFLIERKTQINNTILSDIIEK
jgi:hypothetical protein